MIRGFVVRGPCSGHQREISAPDLRCVGPASQNGWVQWRRRGADSAELEALHAGVPAWLEKQIKMWATLVSSETYFDEWANKKVRPDVSVLMDYETAIRRPESLVEGFRKGGIEFLFNRMDTDEFLDFVDYLVFKAGKETNADELLRLLERFLSEAGSEWKVGVRDGHASLEKRVPEGVATAVVQTVATSGSAGTLLAEAWHSAFGRSPDTEEAYEKAIKAVEEAGAAKVSPNNKRATLGTMIRDMKAQGDWRLPLGSTEAGVSVSMAEALWQGQESRHGGNGYRKPTQDEAEAAVLLAVPLVQLFASGVLARRD